MIPQYSAASIVAENRVLASPASTDSVPTGEGTEDHVAMSTTACRQCLEVLTNVERIIAIEALCAYHGVQFRKPAASVSRADVASSRSRMSAFFSSARAMVMRCR